MSTQLVDQHRRSIDYLRLSITDRCNLRCTYCMPEEGIPVFGHTDILTYEEIIRLVALFSRMGISKVRLTGGEPLVRKGVLHLCREISQMSGIKSLSMTTNGVFLEDLAEDLLKSGITRINVSLDTLQPSKYTLITRRDYFHKVRRGIERALALGFYPVKLNTVVLKGLNDDEIEALAELTYSDPVHVRFIEFMPFNTAEHPSSYLSSDEIIRRLEKIGPLLPVRVANGNGPARHFQLPGAVGKIGIISPISHHFCPTCNRLRLTADGKLRTCLFAREETDLRGLLRGNASDETIGSAILEAVQRKPERHTLDSRLLRKCIGRPMVAIGG